MSNLFKSSNPTFNSSTFEKVDFVAQEGVMTIGGTINKTLISIALVIASGMYVWSIGGSTPLMLLGAIAGFITAMITIFKPHLANYTTPVYAVFEGLFLGGMSLVVDQRFAVTAEGMPTTYSGIVPMAILGTMATFFAMLLLYRTRVIVPTQRFKSTIFAATAGIATVYLFMWIFSMFGGTPFIYGNSMMAIGVNIFVIIIAALNLIMDFELVERGAAMGAPKYMEWYSAFGILVTLVWLYMEILRLLSKLQSRD